MTPEFKFESQSLDDTARLGTALAATLSPGTTIAMIGTLGAGKTHLVQSIAVACGIDRDDVNSPTFVLLQHYTGDRVIHHFDAYRLNDDDEFLELGPEEYFDSDGLTIIEWADRVERCLPRDYIEISIRATGEASRDFIVRTVGDSLDGWVESLAQRLGGD